MNRPRARTLLAIAAAAALATALCGCFNPFDPRLAAGAGISKPKPVPNSPTGVMELFQWCWENRAIAEYREVFTDDYVFAFSLVDSAGNAYRDRPWIREDELISAQNLFVGGSATEEPATSISLTYNNALRAFDDSRPGKNPTWHKEIRIDVVLTVTRPSGQLEVKGAGVFFVVRGDSAKIPPELGFSPDAERWYIERWEDQTVQPGAYAVAPAVEEAGRTAAPASLSRLAAGALLGGERTAAAAGWDPPVLTFGQLKDRYRGSRP